MFLNSASQIPATARSTRIANTGLSEQTCFGKQMLWHTMLCRWGLSRMSRILPQIIEMSENTTTIFAFSSYLLVVHLSKYSIQMKLNKGGWVGFFFSLFVFPPSSPQPVSSLAGKRWGRFTLSLHPPAALSSQYIKL